MKKLLTPIVFVSTAIFILLGYVSYVKIIRPIYRNNRTSHENIRLNTTKEITLINKNDQGKVYSIEIEIEGNSSTDLTLIVGENATSPLQLIQLKKGEINFDYVNDWYSDSCYLQITPKSPTKDSLDISYRFLAI